jgi:hypothetical protein
MVSHVDTRATITRVRAKLSSFIAMKFAVEVIEGLRYKLRMMGVPVEDPCNVFCDNEAVEKELDQARVEVKEEAPGYRLPLFT